MPSTQTSLHDLAVELLGQAIIALDTTPDGAPERRYVSVAEPAWDCEQVTVHVESVRWRSPSNVAPSARGGLVNLVTLMISVIRCALPGVPPSVASLNELARVVDVDGWALWNHVNRSFRDGSLFVGYPCRPFEVGTAFPRQPEGGLAGWEMPVTVELEGYQP